MSRPPATALLLLVLPGLLLTGCASTATVTTWHPAQSDVTGLSRVAVTRFQGPQVLADKVQQRVATRLAESGAYELMDPQPIEGAMAPLVDSPPRDVYAALEVARQMQLDAILIGTVRTKVDLGADLGVMYVRMGDPVVIAELTYELIDVRTGDIRAKRNLRVRHNGDLPSAELEPDVLGRLTGRCIEELVIDVAPHSKETEIPLMTAWWGKGSEALRRGAASAAAGDWETAQASWQRALQENPDSHAAHYNLGVASEVCGDISAALASYRAAVEVSDRVDYRRAVERAEVALQDWHTVLAQRESSRAPPGTSPMSFARLQPPVMLPPPAAPQDRAPRQGPAPMVPEK